MRSCSCDGDPIITNISTAADSEPAPTAEITPSPDAEHVKKAEVNADGAGSELQHGSDTTSVFSVGTSPAGSQD